jgi:hypothetical protein
MPIIKIEDKNGTLTPPALQHFKVGDEISWDAGSHTFVVLFQDRSPFDGSFDIRDSIPRRATNPGRFHYTFVAQDAATKFSVMSACPEIQIGT